MLAGGVRGIGIRLQAGLCSVTARFASVRFVAGIGIPLPGCIRAGAGILLVGCDGRVRGMGIRSRRDGIPVVE